MSFSLTCRHSDNIHFFSKCYDIQIQKISPIFVFNCLKSESNFFMQFIFRKFFYMKRGFTGIRTHERPSTCRVDVLPVYFIKPKNTEHNHH